MRLSASLLALASLLPLPRAQAGPVESAAGAAPPRAVPWLGSRVQGTPDPSPPYRVEPAFPRLAFREPILLASTPAVPRLFVGEQGGRVSSFPPDPACDRTEEFIDLRRRVSGLGSLYGMAFHPRFADHHKVYLCYVLQAETPDGSRLAELEVSLDGPPRALWETQRVLLTFRSGGHNGGCLEFGPEGNLYIATGDAVGPNPPDLLRTGQDLGDLLSCILRIDVDGRSGGSGYAVPPDNPFLAVAGARPEIWAYGFRNPWKMTFDRATGELWTADVGWDLWEMVYLVERGGNYGWSAREGRQPVPGGVAPGPTPILPPLVDHPHSEAASLTGGYVYRGPGLPDLRGAYVYGDYITGRIWGLRHREKKVAWHREVARTPLKIVAFGEDLQGELLVLDHTSEGKIHRLAPSPPPASAAPFPRLLSQTGLFASVAGREPAPGVVPYSIIAPPWEDGVRAERLLALPGSGRADPTNPETWGFPEGTVLVKTVFLDEGPAAGAPRPVETQLLHLEQGSWRPYAYAWDEEGADAALVPAEGKSVRLRLPGKGTERTWRHASRTECSLCHNFQGAGAVLGAGTLQLNREVEHHGARENQLRSLARLGLFLRPLPRSPEALPRLVDPHDASGDLDRRARSYLHANCSHCHDENRGGLSPMRLGFSRSLEALAAVGAPPLQGGFGLEDARLIAPGDPSRSVLYYRLAKMGSGHMPRAGPKLVDPRGLTLVRSWIESLAASDGEGLEAGSGLLAPLLAIEDAGAAAERRARAIGELLASTRGALELAHRLSTGRASEEGRREVLSAARAHARPEVRDLFLRFHLEEGEVPEAKEADPQEILALRGDAGRGRGIFLRDGAPGCKGCHAAGGQGAAVGPDLSHIGKKYPRSTLLAHIVDPSREVAPEHAAYLLITSEGEVLSGLLAARSEAEVALKDMQGRVRRVPSKQVKRLERQPLSLMPESLLRDLTAQEAADLLDYLASLQ